MMRVLPTRLESMKTVYKMWRDRGAVGVKQLRNVYKVWYGKGWKIGGR